MRGVRVDLASGDAFYLDCELEDAMNAFNMVLAGEVRLVEAGGRVVNPVQVTQLTVGEIPTIESPERLKEVAQ